MSSKRINKKVTLRPILSKSMYFKANVKHIADVTRRIGPTISAVNTMLTNTMELETLMPTMLGVSINSVEWSKRVNTYWNNISIVVPEGGKELEIGFTYKSEEEAEKYDNKASKLYATFAKKYEEDESRLSEYYSEYIDQFLTLESSKFGTIKDGKVIPSGNVPINPTQYLLWRYCLVYSKVANLQSLSQLSSNITIYIDDLSESKRTAKAKYALTTRVKKLVIDNIANKTLKTNVLHVINDEAATSKDDIDIDMAFNNFSENEPLKFIKLIEDDNLTTKAFIERCITNGLLRRIDNTTVIATEEDHIGNDMADAVIYIKNDKNKKVVDRLKHQLNSITKDIK